MRKYAWPLPQPLQVICSFKCHKARKPPSALPGTDYPKKAGTRVFAITSGVVVTSDKNPAGAEGKSIVVKHGVGFYSHYLHLSEVEVKVGQRVHAGDTIGRVGNTGASTGAHLHLSLRFRGILVDAHRFLARRVK